MSERKTGLHNWFNGVHVSEEVYSIYYTSYLSPLSLSPSQVFDSIAQIIEQCWHHNSEARLTALRVKKNLSNIQSEHGKTKAPLPTTNQLQVSL